MMSESELAGVAVACLLAYRVATLELRREIRTVLAPHTAYISASARHCGTTQLQGSRLSSNESMTNDLLALLVPNLISRIQGMLSVQVAPDDHFFPTV